MGWRFLLDDRLQEFNDGRVARGRKPLSWADVARLIGVSRQALQNLASNRELKVTNTRHLEALCRFFGCELDRVMVPEPPLGGSSPDDELDAYLDGKATDPQSRPGFHVDELYSEDASKEWKAEVAKR